VPKPCVRGKAMPEIPSRTDAGNERVAQEGKKGKRGGGGGKGSANILLLKFNP
jgi:hypothetical protein